MKTLKNLILVASAAVTLAVGSLSAMAQGSISQSPNTINGIPYYDGYLSTVLAVPSVNSTGGTTWSNQIVAAYIPSNMYPNQVVSGSLLVTGPMTNAGPVSYQTNSGALARTASPLGTGIADGVFFTCPNAQGFLQGTLELTNTLATGTYCAISNATTGSYQAFGYLNGAGCTNFVSFCIRAGPNEVFVLTNLSSASGLAGTPVLVTNEWRN